MLQNITLLLVLSLLIYTTITTLINKKVKYVVETEQIKVSTLKRKAPVLPIEKGKH